MTVDVDTLYYTPQGTVHAFVIPENAVVRQTYAVLPSALHSDPAVFVAVKGLFANCLTFSVKMKAE